MREWWILGLGALAACSPSPPEGVLVCTIDSQCPEDWWCRRDGTCWRTGDADAGVERVDAGAQDAGFDARSDTGCLMEEQIYTVEADAIASRSQRDLAFGSAREMNVSAGAMLLQFTPDVDLTRATRVIVRMYGLGCSDGCDPGDRCDVGEFRVPGTLELYGLSRRFDEPTVTTESASSGVPWAIDRGAPDRGSLLATATYSVEDAAVDFVTNDPAPIAATATYAFLVDRPDGTSNAFVARTRESASPDAVCTVGETPAAQLRVYGCVE